MLGKSNTYVLHSFQNQLPSPEQVPVNKLAIVFYDGQSPVLYTKDFDGRLLELGKGVTKFSELSDVDTSNAVEGSFLTLKDGKYSATLSIGSLTNLSDVELSQSKANQYLRYNPLLEAYSNYYPSYYLHELLDVEVSDPSDEQSRLTMGNQTLYYDHPSGKFKTRPRINQINQLVDVEITPTNNSYQILGIDGPGGIWKNIDLQIVNDPAPKLGNNLDAQGFQIRNSSYRLNTRECNLPIVNIDYKDGDYWVLKGYPSSVINQCVVNVDINTQVNSTSVLMLEIHQSTGAILLGNMPNVQYEDGKPPRLSGNGKIDLITITQVCTPPIAPSTQPVKTTYVTSAALNLAPLGQGTLPSYRYDKSRYPFEQELQTPDRYDTYYDYVESLLTFEPEVSSGKDWLNDKAIRYTAAGAPVTMVVSSSGTNLAIEKYSLGIQDRIVRLGAGLSNETIPVNSQVTSNQYVDVVHSQPIVLNTDFTIEMYLSYTEAEYKQANLSNADAHYLFCNQTSIAANKIAIIYRPSWETSSQQTELLLEIGSSSYVLPNAYTYFYNKSDDFYTHIALQRRGSLVELYIDGVKQGTAIPITTLDTFNIQRYSIVMNGSLSTMRISKIARYSSTLLNTPAIRFGLVGGAGDILDRQVFQHYNWLDRDLEHEIFC